jgi:flagellar biosynthesis/type III secretory pathway chaperone
MNMHWGELLTVLAESVTLYKDLLLLGEEKRQALIGADTAMLEAITRREELRILEGTRLEERRAKATAALATHHKLADRKPTLLMLADAADPDTAEQIRSLGAELDTAVKQLVRLNDTNAALIHQALHFVQYNLNLLTRSQAETTYVPTGGRKATGGSAAMILDRKV